MGVVAQAENPWLPAEFREFLDEETVKNRMEAVSVRVYDGQGAPLEGAEVKFEQISHNFLFGTAVSADGIAGESEYDAKYRLEAAENFEAIVFENKMKWTPWELPESRTRLTKALAWADENNLGLRGHAMIWGVTKYGPTFPPDVHRAMKSGGEEARAYVRRRSLEHIDRIGRAYVGRIVEWDVLNEQPHEPILTDFLEPGSDRRTPEIMVDWFKQAKQADPFARLFINDFDVILDREYWKNPYEQAKFLLDRGAPLEGMGFQGHIFGAGQALGAKEIWERFDEFSDLGLQVAITEFDMLGNGWDEFGLEEDEAKALYLEAMLRTTFAYPEATGFTMWGFWDGRHWKDEGTLVRWRDYSGGLRLASRYIEVRISPSQASVRVLAVDQSGVFAAAGFELEGDVGDAEGVVEGVFDSVGDAGRFAD